MKSFKFKKIGMSVVAAGVVGLTAASIALAGNVAPTTSGLTTTKLQWIIGQYMPDAEFSIRSSGASTITATDANPATSTVTLDIVDKTITPTSNGVETEGWRLSAALGDSWKSSEGVVIADIGDTPVVKIGGVTKSIALVSGAAGTAATIEAGFVSATGTAISTAPALIASTDDSGVSATVNLPITITPPVEATTLLPGTYSTTMVYTLASVA